MLEKEGQNFSEEEIRERISNLREKINILEWDNKMLQINPYKKRELEELKKEIERLKEKISI